MSRFRVSLFTIVLLLLFVGAVAAATSTVVLKVEGMTWGTWPLVVKRALEGLKGVSGATVSFSAEEARVRFDPGLVTVDQLIEAVNRAGFRASLKREEWSRGGHDAETGDRL